MRVLRKVHLPGFPQGFDPPTRHVIYEGPLYTVFDPYDHDKSMVFATDLDGEGHLYIAFHIDGKPVLRNAVFGKRYGKGAKDESTGKADKRTFLYISRQAALELYDVLGGIFSGTIEPTLCAKCGMDHHEDNHDEVINMEHPEHNAGLSVHDMLSILEDDK